MSRPPVGPRRIVCLTEEPTEPPTTEGPTTPAPTQEPTTERPSVPAKPAPTQRLADTGADHLQWFAGAAALLVLGTAMLVLRRAARKG